MSGSESFDKGVKLLLIGDSGVGKTAIMLQYADNTFSETFITTVGIDYKYKYMKMKDEETGKMENIRLEIWDTAGQERFKAITRSYLRGAEGILLVYDITDQTSFEDVKSWMSQIKQFADSVCDKVLVGNKCDLDGDREVTYEKGKEMASEFGINFYEASAKQNKNIAEAFEDLAKQVLKRKVFDDGPSTDIKKNGQKNGCC